MPAGNLGEGPAIVVLNGGWPSLSETCSTIQKTSGTLGHERGNWGRRRIVTCAVMGMWGDGNRYSVFRLQLGRKVVLKQRIKLGDTIRGRNG